MTSTGPHNDLIRASLASLQIKWKLSSMWCVELLHHLEEQGKIDVIILLHVELLHKFTRYISQC